MIKILVIEDEIPLLEEILDTLRFENFEAFGASNGLEGIQVAYENLPDLIICDIMMPQLDGYGVLLELRGNPRTAAIPFIFLTAKADKGDLRRAMELGADDYLTKPFTNEQLLAAVRTRLEKRDMLARLSEQKLEALREQILISLPHELRTPLTAILGYSEILVDDSFPLPPLQLAQIGSAIQTAALRLLRLIENYLAYVQINLIGENPVWIERLRKEYTASPQVCIAKQAQIVARKAGREHDLQLQLSGTGEIHIFDDYLKKVIEEVVDNAFKFSQPGTPVKVIAQSHGMNYRIEIQDQGRGMKPEMIADVGAYMQFERRRYEQQGAGMGLIIAKRLVELHGGCFEIESQPNKGTCVRITLP